MTPVEPEQPNPIGLVKLLPFSKWRPFLFGALYGLLARILMVGAQFGGITLPESMALAFLVFVPFAVSAVTIHMAERHAPTRVSYWIIAPWLSVALCVAGAALAALEGSICVVLAIPLFALVGSWGGVAAGVAHRCLKRSSSMVGVVVMLPVLVGIVEPAEPMQSSSDSIELSTTISASSANIWHHINDPTNIDPAELAGGVAYKISVPFPIEARTLSEGVGGQRQLIWQRGIRFSETITVWQQDRHIAWNY